MSQDRTALIEELKVLQQELEQMGNEFNRDGVIDAQEQEMLDTMLSEINVVKGEIEELSLKINTTNTASVSTTEKTQKLLQSIKEKATRLGLSNYIKY